MKYPVGIQSFERIIKEDFVYVDKTNLVYSHANEGSIYFFSRPRSLRLIGVNFSSEKGTIDDWLAKGKG